MHARDYVHQTFPPLFLWCGLGRTLKSIKQTAQRERSTMCLGRRPGYKTLNTFGLLQFIDVSFFWWKTQEGGAAGAITSEYKSNLTEVIWKGYAPCRHLFQVSIVRKVEFALKLAHLAFKAALVLVGLRTLWL